jgi:hypothetical protein
MFFLIICHIQSNSEIAMIEHLKKQIKNLKLRDLPRENVDTAISLIKTTYQALENALTPEHTYISEDFAQTILEVLQTSSVRRFKEEETQVRHEANKFGGRPQWPPLNQILNLATNTYHKMQAENTWNISSHNKKRAYVRSSQGGFGSAPKQFNGSCYAGTVEKRATACAIARSPRMKPILRRTSRNSRLSSASTTARRAKAMANLETSPSGKPVMMASRMS